MTSFEVRRAVATDAQTLIGNNCAMALETEGKTLDRDVVSRGVQHLLETPSAGFYVVAAQAGRFSASLMITTEWSDWRNGTFWWIQSVYVVPEARRLGAYRTLYAHVQELAASEPGICGFRLYVERDNEIARATYAALGMSETSYRLYEAEHPTG